MSLVTFSFDSHKAQYKIGILRAYLLTYINGGYVRMFPLSHTLKFEEDTPTLAKDANTKDDDWFEIFDPRSSLNKRKRGEKIYKRKKK
ncbi:hypothetical protein NQ317_012645 [Molorchus minor]|uniref:Uncharacterized protein n=1 Tax=Molorchus minor TaxID=1323400 RepID=A0ABQ9J1N3_9CUCU|nr:hypothetical protein NQ317_012645 [Molorchus minor]